MTDSPSSIRRPVITRFAPSPTGRLHLGHAFSAHMAAEAARMAGGRFCLRIDDLDQTRARPDFVDGIFADLAWLGLVWDEPVPYQSKRADRYAQAIAALKAMGLTYPCFCTRKDIAAQIENAVSAPHGPDGPVYPGTCRALPEGEAGALRAAGKPYALRLRMGEAIARARDLAGNAWHFMEEGAGPDGETGTVPLDPAPFGDIVLNRKDAPASYHLSVTVDDADQGITLVTRGEDLFPSTHVHRLLQILLGYPAPRYRHHRLIRDETGKRLAKRDKARAIATLREQGLSAEDVWRQVGVTPPDQSAITRNRGR